MDGLIEFISGYLEDHSTLYKLFGTLALAVIIFLIRRLLIFLISSRIQDVKSSYYWHKGVTYFCYILFLVVVSPIWFRELHSFGTFLGLLSAGLAIALKDPISNLFAWVYIVSRKPFEMGDRIQVNSSEGDILDIGFFEFTLLEIKNWVKADQSTGRLIHIPNGVVFTTHIINYNEAMNYIWNEIPVTVTFESNWKKARDIILKIEEQNLKPLLKGSSEEFSSAKKKYHIDYSNLDPTVYTSIKDNGVCLTLRYLCNPKNRRDSEQLVSEEILNQFGKNPDIALAYPTTRFYQPPPSDT